LILNNSSGLRLPKTARFFMFFPPLYEGVFMDPDSWKDSNYYIRLPQKWGFFTGIKQ